MRIAVCALLAALALFAIPTAAQAQASVDWADAGATSQGAFPSGTTVTGSDGTTATVTYSADIVGGGAVTTPFAPDFVSYFNGTLSTSVTPLFMNIDNSSFDPRDKVTVTIELSQAVTGLQFALGDVDLGTFTDAIEVSYDGNLSGGFTNAAANTAFWTAGASVQRTNDATVNGWRGINGSGNGSTAGTIAFDFGATQVQRIQIVYFSYTGTGDPTAQFVVISDLDYDTDEADLSLTKAVSDTNPTFGSTVDYTLTLSNTGNVAANNVEVLDNLPFGFDYVSSSGFGTYDEITGVWSVPSIAANQTRTLTITGTVSATEGATITNFAEVSFSDQFDGDSTPGNGSTNEDDDDSVSFTVQGTRVAGTPPVLSCPVGVTTFDWDAPGIVWNAGGLNQTFALAGIGDINFVVSSDGVFVNDGNFGGQSPAESNANTGGSATSGNSLHQFLDFANRQQTATTVITLPTAVAGAQFTLFDIDFAANDFADQVTVTGAYQGSTVIPILTNGTANYVVGNTAIGDITSGNTSAAGNVEVTFNQPIDTITIVYGNAPTAPVVPDGQAITIHDIDFCAPQTELSVTKVSSVISDPVNADPTIAKAIPGAIVEYLIQVSNTGVSDAGNVIVEDQHLGDIKLCRLNDTGGPITIINDQNVTGLSVSGTTDLTYLDFGGTPLSGAPTVDSDGCDENIGGFRLTPQGAMNGGTSFSLRIRYRVLDPAITPGP
ncbi:MAG: DUF11 domain-containing protein [Pseudomonadota bacterium]